MSDITRGFPKMLDTTHPEPYVTMRFFQYRYYALGAKVLSCWFYLKDNRVASVVDIRLPCRSYVQSIDF